MFDSFKFTDSTGRNIYLHLPDNTDKETYYYLETPANKLYRIVYDQATRENKEQVVADNINVKKQDPTPPKNNPISNPFGSLLKSFLYKYHPIKPDGIIASNKYTNIIYSPTIIILS